MRTNTPIHKQMVHKGSVNGLKMVEDLAVTCSADGSIKIMTMPDFTVVKTIDAQDMVFALEHADGVLLAGSGKGNVLAYDLKNGECLYGYGVMKKGACRLLGTNLGKSKNRLVCAGEDDSATLLTF